MSQANYQPSEQIYQQAKRIHNKNKSSSRQLQNTLQFIQSNIDQSLSFLSCSLCGGKSKSNVDEAFKRGFKTLTLKQKINYFWKLSSLSQKVQKNLQNQQNKKDPRQILDTTIYIKIDDEYPKWIVTQVIISKITNKMTIVERSKSINLKNYIMRSSNNKQKQAFVLESISQQQQYTTIRISNEGHSFSLTKKYFSEALQLAAKQKINQLLKLRTIQPKNLTQNLNSNVKVKDKQVRTIRLQDKMMTLKLISAQYFKKDKNTIRKQLIQKQKVLRNPDSSYQTIDSALVGEDIISNLNDCQDFKKVRGDQNLEVYYHKNQNKVKKMYKFKCNQIVIFDWLVDQLNNFSSFHKWKQNMQQITCLKIFPSERTKLFYQIFKHPQKMHYIFIRHYFQRRNQTKQKQQSRNDKIHYFFDKSINKDLAKGLFNIPEPIPQVNYILWKFQQVNDQVKLTVEGECDYYLSRQKNLQMIDDYLGNFQKIKEKMHGQEDYQQSDIMINTFLFQNQYIEQINQLQNQGGSTVYFSISQQNQQQNDIVRKKPILRNSSLLSSKKSVSFEEMTLNTGNLLKFKHPFNPFKKRTPILKKPLYGDHVQWEKQWLINSKGELICIDKKLIDAQNGVMKSVFKKIGKNLFGGKSILSISLPVQVFGDDSNLSRLCHSYGYAPVFLEKAKQCEKPLQRFINVIAFSLTTSVLYLRMDKPFNPILGQTYQGLVDGCPIYGQQISHHPPISAVFLKGRGYTLYGNFQAKVQMSLNSAAGSNQGVMHVSFDPRDITKKLIRYTAPAGQVSGIMYGDRKFQFVKKSYFFDEENLLFCEFTWSKHKGKSQYCKFYDSIQGQVVKLKRSISRQNWKNVKKQDIQQQYQLISGRWTGAVYYGKDVLFDTYKQLPHKLQNYPAILQSDSSKRKDLNLRRIAVGQDMDQAQQAKQELEEIQRNDRKLRAKYHGKQH